MSPNNPPTQNVRHVEVAIAGAGFGGLAMAIQLQKHGMNDYLILEKRARWVAPGATTITDCP